MTTPNGAESLWSNRIGDHLHERSVREARTLHHLAMGPEHILLAILNPDTPTIAADVLNEVGITHSLVNERFIALRETGTSSGVLSTVAFEACMGLILGMALARSRIEVSDEDALISLVYGDFGTRPGLLAQFDVDLGSITVALRARGAIVPNLLPPVEPILQFGPRVYFPAEYATAATEEMVKLQRQTGTEWAINSSRWKPGCVWIDSPSAIDTTVALRNVVHAELVEIIDLHVAVQSERLALQE